jgi:stearoyl-CoA desaturase (delta-9 desaturase)
VSARQGFFWWEIDITYYILFFMSWLGIVRDLRPVPEGVLNKNRIIADTSTQI